MPDIIPLRLSPPMPAIVTTLFVFRFDYYADIFTLSATPCLFSFERRPPIFSPPALDYASMPLSCSPDIFRPFSSITEGAIRRRWRILCAKTCARRGTPSHHYRIATPRHRLKNVGAKDGAKTAEQTDPSVTQPARPRAPAHSEQQHAKEVMQRAQAHRPFAEILPRPRLIHTTSLAHSPADKCR